MKKKSLIAILMIAIVCIMGACGEKFDASAYVKSCLDAQFKGEFEEYVKLTVSTKEEAEDMYNEGLDKFMEEYEGLPLTDELYQNFRNAYADMLKAAKYSVKEATEKDGTYIVSVVVNPMKCFETYDEDLDRLQEEFIAEIQEKVDSGEEIPSDEELQQLMAEKVYEDLVQRVQNSEFGEETTVEVHVAKDKDGVYVANEKDLEEMAKVAFDI